jgi:hypothetical protein
MLRITDSLRPRSRKLTILPLQWRGLVRGRGFARGPSCR